MGAFLAPAPAPAPGAEPPPERFLLRIDRESPTGTRVVSSVAVRPDEFAYPSRRFLATTTLPELETAMSTADRRYFSSPELDVEGACSSIEDDGIARPDEVLDLEVQAERIIATMPHASTLYRDIDQGETALCTSLCMAHGFVLRYVLSKSPALFRKPTARVPHLSAAYAYFFQRIEECELDNVCRCPECKTGCLDPCDPPCVDCGSFLRSALSVFRCGVALDATWPTAPAIADAEYLNTRPSLAAIQIAGNFRVLKANCLALDANVLSTFRHFLRQQCPIAVWMNLDTNQVRWFVELENENQTRASITRPKYRFPRATGAEVALGHCVLVVGFNERERFFVARNSFGRKWGADGTFALGYETVTSGEGLHRAVAIMSVCAPDPDRILEVIPSGRVLPDLTCARQGICPVSGKFV